MHDAGVSQIPDEAELRAMVGAFDQTQKRCFSGLIVAMIENSDQVRDMEWISEQFAQTAAMALDLDLEAPDGPAAVEAVQTYAKEHMSTIVNAAFGVFAAVAQAMQAREGGFSFRDAVEEALGYVKGEKS